MAKAVKDVTRTRRGQFLAALLTAAAFVGPAEAFETSARSAILLDFDSGTVLFEKDADQQIPPASLAKLMTIAVIFDQLKQGKLTLENQYFVSERAWREGGAASGGSTMFLPLNSQVSLGDLIKGIIIQSGNDATIVAAEGIAGSVDAFVEMMNAEAKKIGLTASHFTNPHGLPDPELHVTMRDLATLAAYLIREYPDRYHLFSEEEFMFNGIKQGNRNPLLGLGADGLKTGHTAEAGFGLVASAKDGGRRIVMAMAGMRSAKERAEDARALMTFGLQSFEDAVLVSAASTIVDVPVKDGAVQSVAVHPASDVHLLVQRGSSGGIERTVSTDADVTAPVEAGRKLGVIRFLREGKVLREEPLIAASAVEEASWMQKLKTMVYSMME